MKGPIDIVKIMTPFPNTIDGSKSIDEALATLEDKQINYLPVTKDDEPIGVISRHDLLLAKRLIKGDTENSSKKICLEDLCLEAPYLVDTNDHLGTVVSHMLFSNIEHAIVMKKHRVVGLFSCMNAYNSLLKVLLGVNMDGSPPDLTA